MKATDKLGQLIDVGDWVCVYENHELQYGQIIKLNPKSSHIQIYNKGGGTIHNPDFNPNNWDGTIRDPSKPLNLQRWVEIPHSPHFIPAHLLKRNIRDWRSKAGKHTDLIKFNKIEDTKEKINLEEIKKITL